MAFVQTNIINNVDKLDEKIGFKLPFTLESTNQSVTTFEAIKTNLENLVKTQKGERVFQPNLGVDLKKHLFNQITEESIIGLQDDIIEQISIWLPFVTVNDIQTKPQIDKNTIGIEITFGVGENPSTDSVQINVNTGASY